MEKQSIKQIKSKRIKELENISKWLPFSDKEIGTFQPILYANFTEYVKESHTKEECFLLGLLSSDFQYRMRCIKQFIMDNKVSNSKFSDDKNLRLINTFIDSIYKFDGLVDFIVDKMEKYFNSFNIIDQYNYKKEEPYSYFNLSVEVRESLMSDVKFLNV